MQSGTIFGSQPYDLPLNETTTPQYLKSLGYTTPGVGITEPADFHHKIQVSLLKSLWQMEQLTKWNKIMSRLLQSSSKLCNFSVANILKISLKIFPLILSTYSMVDKNSNYYYNHSSSSYYYYYYLFFIIIIIILCTVLQTPFFFCWWIMSLVIIIQSCLLQLQRR